MPVLFEPLAVRSLTIRNRIWVSPMCQYSSLEHDGMPGDWHLTHLGSMAVGGAGLVMTEATAVSPEGRISDRDTGLWNERQQEAWSRITAFIRAQGATAGIQLAHAGRKASTWSPWGEEGRHGSIPAADGGWRSLAPSPIAFGRYAAPDQLDEAGLAKVIADFATAAGRAVAAGFDLIEVHAAHGYLLHEFLSPLSNHRTDAWGGSLENRARLLLDVLRAVRAEAGDQVPVLVRFSGTDWASGGWDEAQTAAAAVLAKGAGADLFDISSGGTVPHASIPVGPGYQVPLSSYVREHAAVRTCTVGLITTPQQAEQIVATGQADAVMLGRQLLREPHFPLRAAQELGAEIDYWPGQYLRAKVH